MGWQHILDKGTLIMFTEIANERHTQISKRITGIRADLESIIGAEYVDWAWLRGDRCARGVYVLGDESTIVFLKLRLQL